MVKNDSDTYKQKYAARTEQKYQGRREPLHFYNSVSIIFVTTNFSLSSDFRSQACKLFSRKVIKSLYLTEKDHPVGSDC